MRTHLAATHLHAKHLHANYLHPSTHLHHLLSEHDVCWADHLHPNLPIVRGAGDLALRGKPCANWLEAGCAGVCGWPDALGQLLAGWQGADACGWPAERAELCVLLLLLPVLPHCRHYCHHCCCYPCQSALMYNYEQQQLMVHFFHYCATIMTSH